MMRFLVSRRRRERPHSRVHLTQEVRGVRKDGEVAAGGEHHEFLSGCVEGAQVCFREFRLGDVVIGCFEDEHGYCEIRS